jgi:hypothetical protein
MLAALVIALQLAAQPSASSPGDTWVSSTSAHYRLTAPADLESRGDWLALADTLHARLAQHFDAAPPGDAPLEIVFCPDRPSYAAVLEAEGIPAEIARAGGVYWTGTRTAYFWRQPSESFTRHLFVHELVHQFQYLAVMDNKARCPAWYSEGLAEHFAFHTWDGARLRTGLSDVVGIEPNIPNMAAAARDGSLDLCAILEGRLGAPKAESWAAVHWLLAGPDDALRARFREHERRLWAGDPFDLAAVLGAGPDRDGALRTGRAWLGSLATTWKIEWIHWDTRGETLIGNSSVVALIRARDDAARGGLEARIRSDGRAGVVLGFRSTASFLLVYHEPGGALMLTQRVDGGWARLARVAVPAATSWNTRVTTAEDGTIRVALDGRLALEHRVPPELLAGPPGLFCDKCRAEFAEVDLHLRH